MKRVGLREFREHATRYLSGEEVLAIEQHGRPLGFFVPAHTGQQENDAATLVRLEQTVLQILAATGLSEEELSRWFDVKTALPDRSETATRAPVSETHASGR